MAENTPEKKTVSKSPTESATTKEPATKKEVNKEPAVKQDAAKKTASKKAAVTKTAAKKSPSKKANTKSAAKTATKTVAKTELSKKVVKIKSPYPAAFLKKQLQALLDEKDVLLESMQDVQREQLRQHDSGAEASGMGDHLADAGNDAYEHDYALSLLSKEQGDLHEINDAILRIENKTYGVCEGSQETIPQMRLEFMPSARYTVKFQEQLEKSGRFGRARLGRSARVAGAEDSAIQSMEESVDV